ncbi:MAG TPA: hypothetical protein PKZ76_08150 [Xanthomonadaceae bacterium]|nr:hypothetical protein [Xanthomonadaceae bacterium]
MILLPVLLYFDPVSAVTLTVGPDPDCNHATLQSAIQGIPTTGDHEIRIKQGTYSQQAVVIEGRRVAIKGGYASCSASTADGTSILDGAGGTQASVLRVSGTGNFVTLFNLVIRRGDAPAEGHGGGVFFNGAGVIGMTRVSVANNYAGFGGGINVSAVGGSAKLHLNEGTVIQNNTAQFDGGGIRLWGNQDHRAELYMNAPDSVVIGNQALGLDPATNQPHRGFGGGIAVIRFATAYIGSPGFGQVGAIFDNSARLGGGIAVAADGSGRSDSLAILFTTDPDRPGRIHGNRASAAGGGVFIEPNFEFPSGDATFCAFDFLIDDNRSFDGSAIFASLDDGLIDDQGSSVLLNNPFGQSPCPQRPTQLGAVACRAGPDCNAIRGNVSETEGGQLTTGATVVVKKHSILRAERVQIRDNVGGQAVHVLHDAGQAGPSVIAHNCLLAGNTTHLRLLQANSGATVHLLDCTIGGNSINAAEVLAVDGGFRLHRSILYQPGKTSLAAGADSRDIDWVLTSERMSLDGGTSTTVAVGDPRFLDPDNGDFRLHAGSDAVDFAPATASAGDLDGNPYNIDLPIKPNRSGPRDLGAYERQQLLPLVRNGDFPVDLRSWSVTPGTSTWVEQGVDPGAVFISELSPPTGTVIGLRQCIPLPGPSAYRLNAHALAPGAGLNRDIPVLVWKYRANSAFCTGTPTVQGELILPRSGSFVTSPFPAEFHAPEGEWTHNSTLDLFLEVRDGDLVGTNSVRAHFDRIVLEPTVPSSDIFSDGFESP